MQQAVESALAASVAEGAVVIGRESSETNLRWANNGLTTNGSMASRSMTVVSMTGAGSETRVGSVTRSVASETDVSELVRASEAAARAAAPADDVAPLVEPYPNSDDWAADPATTGVEVFASMTEALGTLLGAAAGADRALFGFAEHGVTSTFLGTSTGLRRRHDQPTGRLELNAKSADFTKSAWDGVSTRDFSDVDISALVAGLNTRLDWAAKTIELPPGRYETILPPCVTSDLMIGLYWAAAARDAEEGRSVFSAREGEASSARAGDGTRIGERLGPLPLNLYSDPSIPIIASAPFEIAGSSYGGVQSVFDNGLPIERTDWISEGVLTNLARSRPWAAKSGAEPRLFVDNVVMDGGTGESVDEMIAQTERGLLLTTLWYIRTVDPQTLLVTGLTRDGVYLVENGKVTGAVNNFRFNESPVDLLARATQAGASSATLPREWGDYFSRVIMPTLRIPDFNMSTVSAAS
ncbi:MAG: putative Zn-dependent protease-like protein [Pseudonocardiales bacterium]|nr:putative Zn-dependent protease-like protein [Pseudonocardiales bacterium]